MNKRKLMEKQLSTKAFFALLICGIGQTNTMFQSDDGLYDKQDQQKEDIHKKEPLYKAFTIMQKILSEEEKSLHYWCNVNKVRFLKDRAIQNLQLDTEDGMATFIKSIDTHTIENNTMLSDKDILFTLIQKNKNFREIISLLKEYERTDLLIETIGDTHNYNFWF